MGTEPIGEEFVRIRPDMTGFAADIEKALAEMSPIILRIEIVREDTPTTGDPPSDA